MSVSTKGAANEVDQSGSPDRKSSKDVSKDVPPTKAVQEEPVFCISWAVVWMTVANIIFIMAGCAMVAMELWIIFSSKSSSEIFNEATATGHGKLKIILSMGVACVKLIMGIWGLLGVCTRNRTIITLFATLLTIDIIVRVLLLVMLSVSCGNAQEVTAAAIKKSFHVYGKPYSAKSQEFTDVVEKFKKDHMCCSWDSDNTVNLYLDTAWYRETNRRNSSDESETRPQTVPESCCTLHAKARLSHNCTKVDDIGTAYANGNIRGNCLNIVVLEIYKILAIVIVAHALMLTLDAITVFAITKFIYLHSVEDDGSTTVQSD